MRRHDSRAHRSLHSDRRRLPKAGLEYGTDVLQVHTDAVSPGERVVVVDDLIATGGTAMAAISLLGQLNATVLGVACVIDLPELGGTTRSATHGLPTQHLISFGGR